MKLITDTNSSDLDTHRSDVEVVELISHAIIATVLSKTKDKNVIWFVREIAKVHLVENALDCDRYRFLEFKDIEEIAKCELKEQTKHLMPLFKEELKKYTFVEKLLEIKDIISQYRAIKKLNRIVNNI